MPTLRLLARIGQHKAGDIVEYGKAEATYLIEVGKAERVRTEPVAAASAPEPEPAPAQTPTQVPAQVAASDTPQATQHPDEQAPATPTHAELVAQAKSLGLSASGNRVQLADRIQQHHDRQQQTGDAE